MYCNFTIEMFYCVYLIDFIVIGAIVELQLICFIFVLYILNGYGKK